MPLLNKIRISSGLLCAVFLLMIFSPSATGAFKYLREGMTAPKIVGTDLATSALISSEAWVGSNVVVVVFWATWSERSLEELRDLSAFAADHPDMAMKIVAVNVEGQTLSAPKRSSIIQVATELQLPFPVIIDEDLALFYEFGVIAVPSTAIIDTTGILRYGPSGYSLTTHDRIIDSVKVLLGLAEPGAEIALVEGYRPNAKSSRYCNMALNQINRRQHKRALKNLDQAVAADSGFAQPHILRGEVYLTLDSLALATESFAQAVKLDSGSVAALTGLGIAYLRAGQLDSAHPMFAGALLIDDTYTPAALNLGLCLAGQGLLDAALDSVQKAHFLNQRDPLILYYLGQLQLKAGDTGLAAASYETALELLFPAK